MQGLPATKLPFLLSEIRAAAQRQAEWLNRTPVLRSSSVPGLYFKAENLQVTGSFKSRPALEQLLTLEDSERRCGIVTSSSGNFAAAVAYWARRLGLSATIVMMPSANPTKRSLAEAYGARIVECEDRYEARAETVARLQEKEGLTPIHPFDTPGAVLGNAVLGWELVEEVPDCRRIVVPVSGGGLLAGILAAVKLLRPEVEVWGVQPASSNAAYLSWQAGRRVSIDAARTVADGLTATSPGDFTFSIIRGWADQMVVVSETAILGATRSLIWKEKVLTEPAGAVSLAAIGEAVPEPAGTVCILTGGNLDPALWNKLGPEGP